MDAWVVCAPFAEVPEDLHPIGHVRAKILARPEDPNLAAVLAARLARAPVDLEVATEVVQRPLITHFDSHAVRDIGKKLRSIRKITH